MSDVRIEKVGEALLDDIHHGRIANELEYVERMYELLDKEFPEAERVGEYVADVNDYTHNHQLSFGFCDLCGDIIFYDDETWYDLGCVYDEHEQEMLATNLPEMIEQYSKQDKMVQDICSNCWHDLMEYKEQ